MLFPVCDGAFDIPTNCNKMALLTHLAQSLWDIDARDVRISSNSVSFHGGIFRGMTSLDWWNPLNAFGSGEHIVEDISRQVRYLLSFRQLMITTTILCGFGGLMAWFTRNLNSWVDVVDILFLWLSLVAGGVAFGIWRFRKYLQDTISKAPFAGPARAAR